jgi:hypothetical protein
VNTHLELESLPTGGWGYDHFPMSAAYSRTLGMQFLGMTGKFHTSWGEFGGFKHPNALRYEAALSAAFGAKCSIGDQLHPLGELDMATYDLVGSAYAELEEKEPWLDPVTPVADIAVLSQEAIQNYYGLPEQNRDASLGDVGACRILLEGKYLFNYIDTDAPLDGYKLLILPDSIRLDKALQEKIATLCGAEYRPDAFAYQMFDINSGKIMGMSQFEIGEHGYIYDIKEAPSCDDFEAMFILGRSTMNFIDLCGSHTLIATSNSSDDKLLRAIGLRPLKDGTLLCDMTGFFDGSHYAGHK